MPAAAACRTPAGVLALQRTIGNRAVAWMLENDELINSQLLPQALEVEQAGGAAAAGAGGAASAGAAGGAGAAAAGAAGAASAGAAGAGGAASAGAAGAASAGAAGAQIDAGPDPDLIEFDLRSKRRRSPR